MIETDNKNQAPAWLSVLAFFVYSMFFIFLMYRYGYSKTDTSWIRELNYSVLHLCAIIVIVFRVIDNQLEKRNKKILWFDRLYEFISALMTGIIIAIPLFIMMLFNF